MTPRLLPLLAALLTFGATGCLDGGLPHRQILFLSDRDGGWALYTMDASGRHQHRVLPAGHADPFGEGFGFGEPVVSPDGRKVLLARQGISVATLATGALQRLGPGEEAGAAWSPDGTRVAFSGPQGEGLYVVDLRSGRKRTVDPTSQTWTPAWSPDGKWIAFGRQDGYGPIEAYAAHPDGSGLTRLSIYAPGSGGLAWSRHGDLAFIGRHGSAATSHLLVVDARSRRVHVLAPGFGDGAVAWSPDGRAIAYAGTTGRSDTSAIYTVGADGRGRRRLTPSWPPSSDDSPVWSPDGKSLVFARAPLGGSAEREITEVWSMRADGTHERPLTTAFPDGGDNVEPAWVSRPVHAELAPRPQEVRDGEKIVLRVPFAVDGVAAGGQGAAIAPVGYQTESEFRPTPPVLVWRAGHEPARVVASACGSVDQLVLAGGRLAFDCDHTFFDEIAQSMWVVDLGTRIPHEVFFGHGGPAPGGILLDNIVAGDGVLAFGSESDNARGVQRRTIWRVDGFFGDAIRSGPGIGNLVGAGGGRLAVELANGHVEMLTSDGAPLSVLPLPRPAAVKVGTVRVEQAHQFLLEGRKLLFLERRTLRAYDTTTDKLLWQRTVPPGAHLEAADNRLVVYTEGTAIHVVSRGRETIVRTGAAQLRRLRGFAQGLVHAALTANGLYYCFNVADARDPGRVVFVPRAALPK